MSLLSHLSEALYPSFLFIIKYTLHFRNSRTSGCPLGPQVIFCYSDKIRPSSSFSSNECSCSISCREGQSTFLQMRLTVVTVSCRCTQLIHSPFSVQNLNENLHNHKNWKNGYNFRSRSFTNILLFGVPSMESFIHVYWTRKKTKAQVQRMFPGFHSSKVFTSGPSPKWFQYSHPNFHRKHFHISVIYPQLLKTNDWFSVFMLLDPFHNCSTI